MDSCRRNQLRKLGRTSSRGGRRRRALHHVVLAVEEVGRVFRIRRPSATKPVERREHRRRPLPAVADQVVDAALRSAVRCEPTGIGSKPAKSTVPGRRAFGGAMELRLRSSGGAPSSARRRSPQRGSRRPASRAAAAMRSNMPRHCQPSRGPMRDARSRDRGIGRGHPEGRMLNSARPASTSSLRHSTTRGRL